MKSSHLSLIVVLLAAICLPQAGFGADDIYVRQPTTYSGPDHMPGQIIVKFSPGVSEAVIAQINQQNQAKVAYTSRFAGFRVLAFPETMAPQAMVNIYTRNPNVEYAELNYIASAFGVPNDPYYGYQWHFDNADNGGIGMKQAWDVATGAGVVVAVVDTGVRTAGARDGVPVISGGYDFVNGDNDPEDDHGHGTHVSGTIAQHTNNGVGVAGVAYGCSIMPVKVLGADGSGTHAQIADGIHYAADHGANVINMSLGGFFGSQTLEEAVAYAHGKGVTIVCASGNYGFPLVSYPAAYDAYCIAVGATRYDEAVTSYSNGGSQLDLTAPGGDVYVDQNGDGYADGVLQETFAVTGGVVEWRYEFWQGTSMAAPHVSGVAALLIDQGTYTTPAQIKNRLESTAKDKGPAGWDTWYGWGIVNAAAALGSGAPPNQSPTADFTYSVNELMVTFTDASTDPDGTVVAWSWTFGDGASSTAQNPTHTYASGGDYTVTLTVTDDDGATDSTSQVISVTQTTTNLPPVAGFEYSATDLAVTFTDTSTDSDGSVTAWSWDFGDGQDSSEQNPTHTYASDGTYTVALTVTDDGGLTDTVSESITVIAPTTGGVLKVLSITGDTQERLVGRKNNFFISAVANVKIVDGDDVPVQGATVTGEWSIAVGGTAAGLTDGGGLATLTSPETKAPKKGGLVFRLTIVDVQKDGHTYDDGPIIYDIPWMP